MPGLRIRAPMLERVFVLSMFCAMLFAAGCGSGTQAPSPTPTSSPITAASPEPSVKRIWDYQKELELSDAQVNQMKSTVQNLEKTMTAQKAKLQPLNQQLQKLLATDAPLPQIKATLKQIGTINIEMRIADTAASRKINATMSKAQMLKWRDIQKQTRQQQNG
jgi:hypothetical protein